MIGGKLLGADPEWVLDEETEKSLVIERDDGVASLEWTPVEGGVELRHLKPNGVEVIYTIEKDTKSVVSGLDEGRHEFQLRPLEGGSWGKVLRLENEFMERSKVEGLLVIGGVIVAVIVGAVVLGSLRSKEG